MLSKEELLSDIQKMKSYMTKHNSFSMTSRYMHDYNFLCKLAYYYYGIVPSYEGIINDLNTYQMKIKKDSKKVKNNWFNKIRLDHPLYLTTTTNFCEMFNKCNYVDIPFMNGQETFNMSETKEILLDYYSMFDERTFNIVKKALNEIVLTNSPLLGEQEGGLSNHIILLDKSYIILAKDIDSSYLRCFAHELGHAVERTKYEVRDQKALFIDNDFMLEVPAIFYEYEFSEYLKKNRIGYTDALVNDNRDISIVNNYSKMYKEATSYSRYNLGDDGTVLVMLPNGMYCKYYLDLFITRGIGTIIALHLCGMYENDRENFDKKFNDFLSNRKETSTTDKIIKLGFDLDEFESCDLIKDRVYKLTNNAKKRFNINV